MQNYKSKENYQKVLDAQKKGKETNTKNALLRKDAYNKNPVNCLVCGKPIDFYYRNRYKFCSHSCAATFNNIKSANEKFCKNCGKNIFINYKKIFCSRECEVYYKKIRKINKWLIGEWDGLTPSGKYLSSIIRDYLLKEANYTCELCGWNKINPRTKISPVQIHHIDGNYKNNKRKNLQVLCPNCHSLTDSYGSGNRGNGRDYRYKN